LNSRSMQKINWEYREEFGFSSFLFRAQRIMEFWEKMFETLWIHENSRYRKITNILFKFQQKLKPEPNCNKSEVV
jgi:hypothetical protein